MKKSKILALILASTLLVSCGGNKPATSESSSTSEHTHTTTGGWKSDTNNHYHICNICGEHFDVAAHTWGIPEIIEEPTVDKEGQAIYTCPVCEHAKLEVLPKLEYEFIVYAPSTYNGVPTVSLLDELGNAYVTKGGITIESLSAQNGSLKYWSIILDSEKHLCEENADVTFSIDKAQLRGILYSVSEAEEIINKFVVGDGISTTQNYNKVEHSGNLTHVFKNAPSCSRPGYNEHYQCPFCDKIFADAAGTSEKTLDDF